MKNILVFFGGKSTEHDVSCITGVLTVNGVDKSKYNAIPIYVSRKGSWFTGEKLKDVTAYKDLDEKALTHVTIKSGENKLYALKRNKLKELAVISGAINCMHGACGEDGALKGVMDFLGVPVVGSPIAPSSVAMDKVYTKYLLNGLKIKTLPYMVFDGNIDKIEEKFTYPVMVKPSSQGSSIGVNKAKDRKELEKSINKAKKFDDKVLIERCALNFYEINCAVYRGVDGIVVSECEMPKTDNNFLTFEDKYMGGTRLFPAPISNALREKIQSIALKIYEKMYFSGVIRIDFIVEKGEVYVNEINTVPGSMAYYLFSETLKGFSDMLTSMIEKSMQEFNKNQTLIKKFDCNVLDIKGSKGSKRL